VGSGRNTCEAKYEQQEIEEIEIDCPSDIHDDGYAIGFGITTSILDSEKLF